MVSSTSTTSYVDITLLVSFTNSFKVFLTDCNAGATSSWDDEHAKSIVWIQGNSSNSKIRIAGNSTVGVFSLFCIGY